MPSDGRTPSTGCITVALGILAVVVGLPFLFRALSDDGSDGDGSGSATTVDPETPVSTTSPPPEVEADPVPVASDPGDYTITYRLELFSGDEVVVDTEVRTHRAPFEAEIRVTEGEPGTPDATEAERTTLVMAGFETAAPAQDPTVLTAVPGPPARSGHVGGDVAAAVDQGLAEPLGRRLTIASIECDLYRTKSPVDVHRLEAATDDDFTDVCIAPDGLVLREEWHSAGELFRRRTAIDVDRSPVSEDAIELTGRRIPDSAGGGRVRALEPDSTGPGVDHLLPSDLPDGFESRGRFVYIGDMPDTGPANLDLDRTVSLVDVFVSGDDVIVVENGGSTGASPLPESGGVAVDLPEVDLPEADGARALVRSHQNEVVFATEGSRFVRLASTLPLDDLVDLARSLTPVAGTGEVTPLSDELDITGRLATEDLVEHEHDGTVGEHTHDGETHTHDG